MSCPCCAPPGACCVNNKCSSVQSAENCASGVFRGTGTSCSLCDTSFSSCTVTVTQSLIGSVSLSCSDINFKAGLTSAGKTLTATCGVLEYESPCCFPTFTQQATMFNSLGLLIETSPCVTGNALSVGCNKLDDTTGPVWPYAVAVTLQKIDTFIANPGAGTDSREYYYNIRFDTSTQRWISESVWSGQYFYGFVGVGSTGQPCGTALGDGGPSYIAPPSAYSRCHACGRATYPMSPGLYECNYKLIAGKIISGACCQDPFDHTLTIACSP